MTSTTTTTPTLDVTHTGYTIHVTCGDTAAAEHVLETVLSDAARSLGFGDTFPANVVTARYDAGVWRSRVLKLRTGVLEDLAGVHARILDCAAAAGITTSTGGFVVPGSAGEQAPKLEEATALTCEHLERILEVPVHTEWADGGLVVTCGDSEPVIVQVFAVETLEPTAREVADVRDTAVGILAALWTGRVLSRVTVGGAA